MPREARQIPGNAGAALLAQPLARLGACWRRSRPTGGGLGPRACPDGERRAPAACPPMMPSMQRGVLGPQTPAQAPHAQGELRAHSTLVWERRPGFAPGQKHLQATEDCSIVPRRLLCLLGWLRHVKVLVQEQTHTMYSHALLAVDSLNSYAVWQPRPRLHPIVYGRYVPASSARAWGLARCGHHCLCNGRTARHRGSGITPCRFCTYGQDTLEHALLHCCAHNILRERWSTRSPSQTLSLQTLFCTDPWSTTARQIVHNVDFVASVCQAAEACEM